MGFVHWLEVMLAFGFMICIHEWGHFLVCRFFGVEVEEFCIGFPPRIVSRKWGKTLYSLGSVPLGGFCKPKGGDLSGQTAEEMYAKAPEPGEFLFASWWKRIIIFLAGPGMNFISGFVIIFLILIIGERISTELPILGFVPPDSLAYQAGFQKNDHLLKADGKEIKNLNTDLNELYQKLETPGSSASIVLERGGKVMNLTLSGDPRKFKFNLGFFEYADPIIGDVPLGTPARKAGIRPGDTILSVNGTKVSEWMELTCAIKSSSEDVVHMEISRNGKSYPVTVQRIYNGADKVIGIAPKESAKFEIKRMGVVEAVPQAFLQTVGFCQMYLGVLGKLVTGQMSFKDNVGGAVTILRTMYQKASQGSEQFLKAIASISLILGLMNLLPLGIVDGGQILLCLIEGIKRQPVSVKFQSFYQVAGFTFVVGLMIFAVGMDIWSWVMEGFHSQIR